MATFDKAIKVLRTYQSGMNQQVIRMSKNSGRKVQKESEFILDQIKDIERAIKCLTTNNTYSKDE